MALKSITLTEMVDKLDNEGSEYADFFRPTLGYDALFKLYEGINDSCESLLSEIEDETGYQFPTDVIELYMCSNGGYFADIELFPISNDSSLENDVHRLNVFNKELKESIGLNNSTILFGRYIDSKTYIICSLNEDNVYQYSLWDGIKQETTITVEYLIQLLALEISYNIDNEGFMELINSSKK